MAYYLVNDFQGGLDLRKSVLTAPAGTLRLLTNAHITPGGEIEKRKAYPLWVTLPANTFGLAAIETDMYVFGTIAEPPPIEALTFKKITNAEKAEREAKRGPKGRLIKLGTLRAGIAMPNMGRGIHGMRQARLKSKKPRPDKMPKIDMSLFSSGDYTLWYQQIIFPTPGTQLIERILDWDVYDGKLYVIILADDDNVYHFFDGVHVPTAQGYYCKTWQERMYAIAGRVLYYSPVGDPGGDWTDTMVGAGFVELGSMDADASDLLGLEIYYGKLAIMSRRATQIWTVDPDPQNFQLEQVIRYLGTVAPQSVRQYGNGDVLFMAESGIRSLRARDINLSATMSDIGSPIDNVIQDHHLSVAFQTENEIGTIDPVTGRYHLFSYSPDDELTYCFVLSYFPGPKVTGWSVYELEFNVEYACLAGNRIVVREGDNIRLYGGEDGQTYDDCLVTVRLPFLSAERPAHDKTIKSFDMANEGVWSAGIALDMENPDLFEPIGNFGKATFNMGKIPVVGQTTHFALELTHEADGPARLANVLLHYETGDSG